MMRMQHVISRLQQMRAKGVNEFEFRSDRNGRINDVRAQSTRPLVKSSLDKGKVECPIDWNVAHNGLVQHTQKPDFHRRLVQVVDDVNDMWRIVLSRR